MAVEGGKFPHETSNSCHLTLLMQDVWMVLSFMTNVLKKSRLTVHRGGVCVCVCHALRCLGDYRWRKKLMSLTLTLVTQSCAALPIASCYFQPLIFPRPRPGWILISPNTCNLNFFLKHTWLSLLGMILPIVAEKWRVSLIAYSQGQGESNSPEWRAWGGTDQLIGQGLCCIEISW